MNLILTAFAICLSLYSFAQADSIVMKNGARYGVNIIEETDKYIRIETIVGSQTKIPLPEIEQILRCDIDLDEVNQLTHERTVALRRRNIGRKHNLQVLALRIDNNYIINFSSNVKLGCASPGQGKVNVIFEDGETVELLHFADADCSNRPTFSCLFADYRLQKDSDESVFIAIQKAMIKKFSRKTLDRVILTGSQGEIEIKINDRGKYYLKDNLRCLVDRF
ncbi:MAG: hypothetical protein HKN87_00515 [Saprospiraceae bacterium]|nr:hypothetical protein [Saprospiraceae bacterium]